MVCSLLVFSVGQRVAPLFSFAGAARATIAAVLLFSQRLASTLMRRLLRQHGAVVEHPSAKVP